METTGFSCVKYSDKSIVISSEHDQYSLIWLPGFGDSSDTYKSLFLLPESPAHNNIRIRILQPPSRPITMLDHQAKNSWFNIKENSEKIGDLPESQLYDMDQFEHSKQIIQKFIGLEMEYWKQRPNNVDPLKRIFLGGVGQGGILSLSYGLEERPLAGVACWNGYLLKKVKLNNLGKIPVLLVHGLSDQLFKQQMARKSYSSIIDAPRVSYKPILQMQHVFRRKELSVLNSWITDSVKSL